MASKLKSVIETAREQVAELIGAPSRDVIFTSCATESNNAAIAAALKANPTKRHIVTSQVEHSSVLNYCMALQKEGYRVTYLPVNREGLLTLADLETALTDDTAVVSLMWANNETGVLFPWFGNPAVTTATRGTTRRGRQPLFGIIVEKSCSHHWWRNLSDRRLRRFMDCGGRSEPNHGAVRNIANIPQREKRSC